MGFLTLLDEDINIFSGDTFELELSFLDKYKQQISLTGGSGRMMLRSTKLSPAVMDIAGVIDGNTVTFSMDDTQTASLIGDSLQQHYVYDVEITLVDGSITTVMAGQVTIDKDVTRD